MRTLLLAAVSLSALTPSADADACGSYIPEPQVFRLSAHGVGDRDQRAFVLLPDDRVPERGLAWKVLAPRSFDRTARADAKPFASPMTFTLVGPSGTRVVASKRHVFLSDSWRFKGTAGAVELPVTGVGFTVALAGEQTGVRWRGLDNVATTPATIAWLTAHGANRTHSSVHVNWVDGTDLETIAFYPEDGTQAMTIVRRSGREIARTHGMPIGALVHRGITQLVVVDDSRASLVYL